MDTSRGLSATGAFLGGAGIGLCSVAGPGIGALEERLRCTLPGLIGGPPGLAYGGSALASGGGSAGMTYVALGCGGRGVGGAWVGAAGPAWGGGAAGAWAAGWTGAGGGVAGAWAAGWT
ncbi:MAG: hypothetical protein ABII00_08820, partial [Elusimicrobiota bacterium]